MHCIAFYLSLICYSSNVPKNRHGCRPKARALSWGMHSEQGSWFNTTETDIYLRTCASRQLLAKIGLRTATAEQSWTDPPPFSRSLPQPQARLSRRASYISASSFDPRVTQDAGSQQRIVLISTYRWRRYVPIYTPRTPASRCSRIIVHSNSWLSR